MDNKKIADLSNAVDVFNLNVPFVADKLMQYRFETEREIYTLFGFNNNFEKKERLLTDEVNVNNDFINCNIDSMYKKAYDFDKDSIIVHDEQDEVIGKIQEYSGNIFVSRCNIIDESYSINKDYEYKSLRINNSINLEYP